MEANLKLVTILPDYGESDSNSTMENFTVSSNFFWHIFFTTKYLRHTLPWTFALIIAYCIIFIIGFIGNCMVISIIVLRPKMHTITNMFIMNLAVADLFVIVFCLPATLLSNVFTPWILGTAMCKGVGYVQGVSVCASAYSLAAISVDRCKAIYRPMEQPRGFSKSQALSTICLIWAVALLVTLPWAVIFDVISIGPDQLSYCVENWENDQHGKIYFLVVNVFVCYTLPLFVISITSVIIWCHVNHRKVPQDSDAAGNIKRMHRRTRQGVRKMLSCVTFTFLISWLPLYIIVTRLKFANITDGEANVLKILLPFAQWLGACNSFINPVLYAFLNQRFREMFISLLPNWIPFVQRKNFNRRNSKSTARIRRISRENFSNNYRQLSPTFSSTARKNAEKNNPGKNRQVQFLGVDVDRRTKLVQRSFGNKIKVDKQFPLVLSPVITSACREKHVTVIVAQSGVLPVKKCIVADL